jgi:cytochrome c553
MSGFAGALTRDQIEALAEYYARQQPALATVDKPLSRISAGR